MAPGELNGRPKVLVIDNEEAIASLLSRILSLEGYQVTCASNGRVGLAKMREARYDAIICNLRMPGMDGLTFYEELLRLNPDQASRVIFCTGLAVSDLQSLILRTGRKVLLKPFEMEEVHRMVGSVVNAHV